MRHMPQLYKAYGAVFRFMPGAVKTHYRTGFRIIGYFCNKHSVKIATLR